jgi:hypothetical protein
MIDKAKSTLTVRFVNGTEQKFEFTRPEESASIAQRIQDALNANQLLLELDDRLMVVPFQNILTVEISPPPPKVRGHVLRNVRLVEGSKRGDHYLSSGDQKKSTRK